MDGPRYVSFPAPHLSPTSSTSTSPSPIKTRRDSPAGPLHIDLHGLVPDRLPLPLPRTTTTSSTTSSDISIPQFRTDIWDWLYEKIVGKGAATADHRRKKLEKHNAKYNVTPTSSLPSTCASSIYDENPFEDDDDDEGYFGPAPSRLPHTIGTGHGYNETDDVDESYYSYMLEKPTFSQDVRITPRGGGHGHGHGSQKEQQQHHRSRRRRGPLYAAGADYWLECRYSRDSSPAPPSSSSSSSSSSLMIHGQGQPGQQSLSQDHLRTPTPIDIPKRLAQSDSYFGPYEFGACF